MVAETTTGCLISAEAVTNHVKQDGHEKQSPSLPEDLGTHASRLLLEEIKRGGVVDSSHQVFNPCSYSCLRLLQNASLAGFMHVCMLFLSRLTQFKGTMYASHIIYCIFVAIFNFL